MKIEKVKIEQIIPNKDNPRIIKDYKYRKLVESIKKFPKMLEIRPIVVNDEMVVLGGNMRLKASIEAGLKELFIINAKDLSEEEQNHFIIADNVNFGEWDYDMLANEWNTIELIEWGVEIPVFDTDESFDIEQKDSFSESVNFTIKCESMAELEELQTKLNHQGGKIGYKEFLVKTAL